MAAVITSRFPSLKFTHKLLQGYARLAEHRAQSASFNGSMHRHYDDTPVRSAHDVVRAGLMIGGKTEPPRDLHGVRSVNIRRQSHASASSGSVTKWSRTRLGNGTPAARK